MKKILIVSRRLSRKNKLVNWVSEVYLQLALEHGILPIIVPIANETPNMLKHYLNDYNGLLMVEGGDLGPHYYNMNYKLDDLDEYDAKKDELEVACFKHAFDTGRPILGLCRGMHIINAMLGGTNHKDIHEANKNSVQHINYDNYDGHRHKVRIVNNTPLSAWYNETEMMVNSYHHQGIKNLSPKMQAMAYSNDKLVEGIYLPGNDFLVGLQFHPERMYNEHAGNKLVFDSYFNAVSNYK